MGYSRKNPNSEGWGYTFCKKPLEFFVFLVLEIPDKKLNPWIFHKIVLGAVDK